MTTSRLLRFLLPLPMLLASVAFAPSASADMLPPQACDRAGDSNDPSVVGQACDVAGENADEPGICVAATCGGGFHEGGPEAGADGGAEAAVPAGYSCYLCETPNDAGESASGSSSGSSGGTGSSGKGSSGGGCAMSPGERDGSVGGAMLAVGLFAFAAGRRKKRA